MPGQIYQYFSTDHRRLEELLNQAAADPAAIDDVPYAKFRAGLLKHIGMEEKILFPAIQKYRGGLPLPVTAKLRLDHGALAALLVPPPSRAIVATLRAILAQHNVLEEAPGGVYETGDELTGSEIGTLMDVISKTPDVPVHPYNAKPYVIDATRRALARAGYDFDKLAMQ